VPAMEDFKVFSKKTTVFRVAAAFPGESETEKHF